MAKSKRSIYAALTANLVIAAAKFIAGSFSNSASMISEGIHSVVDTFNQILILYGLRRSHKPANKRRPFGYGKELYFYSFIVSILIFGLGGGLSVYQGIIHIIHPEVSGNPAGNYIVIGVSMIMEGWSFVIAVKEFDKVRNGLSWWSAIINSKDPSAFLVLFEDGAAVLGLLIVLCLMIIGHHYDLYWLDGLASVLVGVLLISVSLILARESRSLLMGEGIAPETQNKIRKIAEADAAVESVKHIISTYQSPEDVILIMICTFKPDINTEEITDSIDRIRAKVKAAFPLIHFVFIQPQTAS